MRLQDHIDFTTLQWVKPELDETLALAREALESYVDNPGNRDAMRSCADSLHQVHGTLRMVELYGAAMVTEEMETLAISLLEDHVANREEAYAALMRGLMQLPDYLERLSGGHRDVPVVLLPLLNDLRSSRGQQALHESALFTPNLDAPLPLGAPGADDPAAAYQAIAAAAGQRRRPRAIRAPVTSCHQARSSPVTASRSARSSHQPARARRPPIATVCSEVTA